MTGPLTFDGLTYISIKDAAAGTNLSTEYLAHLARIGRIRGHKAAHMWFIEMHSLQRVLASRDSIRTTEARPTAQ